MTFIELWGYVRDGGTLVVLLLIIVGGMRGDYIWKREADEYRKRLRKQDEQIERLERAAVGGTALARRSLSHAERARSDPEADGGDDA
jgi:hypothetical protein